MAYSRVEYTGDGSQTNFTFSFPYISQTHVKASLDTVETEFTWINSSTIQISPAPASGVVVAIYRETSRDARLVDFENGAIVNENSLDTSALQSFYLAQESIDAFEGSIAGASAVTWDAKDRRIINVADPEDDQDATTKLWVETAMTSQVDQAAGYAEIARDSANSILDGSSITSSGSITPRSFEDRFADVANVKDFGAIGDGESHPLSERYLSLADAQALYSHVTSLTEEIDWAAIQAAVDYATTNGGVVYFPPGTYLVSAAVDLKDDVVLSGSGWEGTEVKAGGDHPVFQYNGTLADQLRRGVIRDMMIRGGGMANLNAHGIVYEWANKPKVENVQFRSCRHCIQAAYTIDLMLDSVYAEGQSTDQNYIGLYLKEIDSSTYGTVDNTQMLNIVGFRQMGYCGVRVEGSTGMKATNVACLGGEYGWYFGDAPLGADARLVRFLHLTNCFADTQNLVGWKFSRGSMAKLRDVKMINCWAGSVSDTDNGQCVYIGGMEHSVISGGVFALAKTNIFRIENSNDIRIEGIETYDHNWAADSHPAIDLDTCGRITIGGVGVTPKLGSGSSAGFRLTNCNRCSIQGGSTVSIIPVELVDSTHCIVTGLMAEGSFALVESGTSDFNTIVGNHFELAPTISGASTVEALNGGTTNPRIGLIGGSDTEPAIYWRSAPNSGWHRRGSYGIGYSVNGTLKFAVDDDGKVIVGTHTATADTAVSGYIEVKDAGGTTRKLAVIT